MLLLCSMEAWAEPVPRAPEREAEAERVAVALPEVPADTVRLPRGEPLVEATTLPLERMEREAELQALWLLLPLAAATEGEAPGELLALLEAAEELDSAPELLCCTLLLLLAEPLAEREAMGAVTEGLRTELPVMLGAREEEALPEAPTETDTVPELLPQLLLLWLLEAEARPEAEPEPLAEAERQPEAVEDTEPVGCRAELLPLAV